MQGVHLRKYGVEATIPFELYEVDGVNLRTDAADAGTDCNIMKDEGADATCTNDFVDEGMGYSITLTSTEMEAARIVLYIIDSATKVWLDKVIVIETYGNASAQHAFDFDTATQKVDVDTIKTRAITCAAGVTIRADVGAAAAPGAANGMFIGGTNAATTVASLSVTGQLDAGNLLIDDTTVFAGTTTFIDAVALSSTLAVASTTTLTGAVTMTAGLVADITGDLSGTVGTVTTLTGHTAQSGDSYAVVAHADHGNAKLVRSTTPANKLDVSATGEAGLDFANIKDATGAHTLTNITVPAVTAVTGAVGSVTGAVGSVAGNVDGNVSGSVATCAAATVSAIDDIDFSATMKASIETACDASLVTYDGPTDTEMLAAHTTTDALIASEHVTTDGLISTADTVVDAIKVQTTALDTLTKASGDGDLAAILVDTGTTIPAAIAAVGGLGTGAIAVNHDTGGAGNMTYLTADGVAINNAEVAAYLKADYDAGNKTSAYLKGITVTDVNGEWTNDLMLDAETYTIVCYKQNYYGPDTKEVTVS